MAGTIHIIMILIHIGGIILATITIMVVTVITEGTTDTITITTGRFITTTITVTDAVHLLEADEIISEI